MHDLNYIKLEDLKVGDILTMKELKSTRVFVWEIVGVEEGYPIYYWVSDSCLDKIASYRVEGILTNSLYSYLLKKASVFINTGEEVFSL